MRNALIILHLIFCVVLTTIVLLQSGKDDGLSGAISGSSADTFFGKSGGRTRDQILKRWTTVVAVLFLVSSVVLSLWLKSV